MIMGTVSLRDLRQILLKKMEKIGPFLIFLKKMVVVPILIWLINQPVTICFAGAGTTAVNFLRIGPGAREAGMGDVGVAFSDNSNLSYYNPSSLVGIEGIDISFMHLIYIQGINYSFMSYGSKVKNFGSVGLNIVYLNSGKMDKLVEDSTGTSYTKEGTFSYENLLLSFSFAKKLFFDETLSLGANAKFFTEKSVGDTIFGTALDLGALFERERYSIGFSIQNIGPNFGGSDPLPVTIRTGIASKLRIFRVDDVSLAFDVLWPIDTGKFKQQIGVEYWFLDLIAARIGYKANYDLEGFTFGGGFKAGGKFFKIQLDYAYIPMSEEMGITHRISLTLKFR